MSLYRCLEILHLLLLMGYSLFYKNTFDALLKGVFLCLLYKLVLSGRQLRKSEWFLVSLCPWPFQKGSNLIRLRDIDSIFCKMKTRSEHLNTKICSDGENKLSKTFFCKWIFLGEGGVSITIINSLRIFSNYLLCLTPYLLIH